MFKYTRAAIDIVISDIKRYCNLFKYASIFCTIIYLGYSIFYKSGNFVINIILLVSLLTYSIFEFITHKKDLKLLKRIVRRSYKIIKFTTKGFTLAVMLYSIYMASVNASPISIILATLMIIMWVLQLLFEVIVEIANSKKDLIVAGFDKDMENLKKPVTTVNNFIKKIKGEELVNENNPSKEFQTLEKKILKSKKEKVTN